MSNINALINIRIYDYNAYIEDAYIIFNEKIQEVGSMKKFIDRGYNIMEGNNALLLPNFVVGHTHMYSTLVRGLDIRFNPKNFKQVLEQLWWKFDSKLNNEDSYYSAIVSGCEYIKNGVTTIIDHHASGMDIKNSLYHLKKAICEDVGMRGSFCFETSDRFNIDNCIEENLQFYKNNKSQNSIGLFGLHASMTLSEKTLKKVSEKLGNIPIHIHVAESEFDQNNKRIVERLDEYNLLNENSILSHCIHIDEKEASIIKKKNCYIALNVSSNMNNGVGLPDYSLFKRFNINSMANEIRNLYLTMNHKLKSPIAFQLSDLLQIIKNNYEYINKVMNIKIGKIEKDYKADFLLVSYNEPTPINSKNIFAHLVFGLFNNFKPKHVWCNGKHIVNQYKISNKLEKKYLEAKQIAKKLWIKIDKGD